MKAILTGCVLFIAAAVFAEPAAMLTDPVNAQDPSHMYYQHRVTGYPAYQRGEASLLTTNGQCYVDRPCTNFTYVTYMRSCPADQYERLQSGEPINTYYASCGLPVIYLLLTSHWSSQTTHTDIVSGDSCDYAFTLSDLARLALEADGTWSMLNAVSDIAPVSVRTPALRDAAPRYFSGDWCEGATNMLYNNCFSSREHRPYTLAIYTDHDADVTVGNWSKSFVASNEVQVVQIQPEVGSGAITVATDPTAEVYMRVVNRDYDGITAVSAAFNTSDVSGGDGFMDDRMLQQLPGDMAQYAVHVAIASPTSVCVRVRGQWDTAPYADLTKFRIFADFFLSGVTLDRFEKGAGIALTFPMGPITTGSKFECYGTKIFPNNLLTLAELDDMYDKDKARIAEKFNDTMSWNYPE